MRTQAISFGSNNQRKTKTYKYKNEKNEVLVKLAKYWKETGDLRSARIDYYSGKEPIVTLIGEPPKPHIEKVSKFAKFKNFLKNIAKKSIL